MKIHFATLALPPYWEAETVLLARSLRKKGGGFAQVPLTVLTLEERPFPEKSKQLLRELDVETSSFTARDEAKKFPLGILSYAAGAAETTLSDRAELLVWLLPDTLILQPPIHFALTPDKKLAYRPVHHKNIGSDFNRPPDKFWDLVYQHTEVPQERLFQMITCYGEAVRPYFNAGILVIDPREGLLKKWATEFDRTFQHPDFTPFFDEPRYAIFMHQAILSGVLLNGLTAAEMSELPESYNYPLHMHVDYPASGRAAGLSDLVTARYEKTDDLTAFLESFEDRGLVTGLIPE